MNVLMPQLGETVAEGTVANWHKKVGDTVAVDELLFDVETDKVSMEVPAIAAGVLTKILVPAGTTVDVGTVLAVIDSGAEAAPEPPAAKPAAAPSPAPAAAAQAPPGEALPPSWYAAMPPSMNEAAEQYSPRGASSGSATAAAEAPAHAVQRDDHQRLSPAVRRLAAEYRVDLGSVAGSGRNGRITRRNLVEHIQTHECRAGAAATGRRACDAS